VIDDDDELGQTAAATEYAVTDRRVSLQVMFFRGVDDRYERERMLGEGGMGIVELHKDQRIGRSVAMKILREDFTDSASHRRFLHEAQLQGQLEHPAIVPVYDLGEGKNGAFYFTMKRIRGVTLHEVIVGLRKEDEAVTAKYSRRKLLSAFSQVCLAIDFAHTRGVIHRDLKPANIMLGDFGEVYVLDWGIAKVAGGTDDLSDSAVRTPLPAPATQAGAMLGTPGYMAPEQFKSEEVTPKVDVYSLGAILFELLALEPLHPRSTKLHEIIATTFDGLERRPGKRSPHLEIPPELDDITAQALARAPEDRFAHARELHEAVERYLDGERDLEARRIRSGEHLQKAQAAIHDAEHGSPEQEIASRRRAMVEIGRAVAQDPDNREALESLAKLLRTSARTVPPEVIAAIEHGEQLRLKRIAHLGGYSYLAVWAFLPLIIWMGVRSWTPVIGMYVGLNLAGISSLIIRKRDQPNPTLVVIPLIASNIGFGFIAGMLGPLVFVPTVAVVNTVAFAIHARRGLRVVVYLAGLGSFLVPLLLELTGVIPTSYSFDADGMTVLTHRLELRETPTMIVLVISQIFAVTLGVFIVGIIRDHIDKAEKSTYTYAWHLREWIPDSHKRATDPVNRRTTPIAAVKPPTT
jgi:serine/threonine protein kinase